MKKLRMNRNAPGRGRIQNTFTGDQMLPQEKEAIKAMFQEPEGIKFDQDKKQWFAMPLEVAELLADVFAAGEKKYATFNCLKPFDDGDRRFYDATMRHLKECQIDPLARDPETGCYHGSQVAWNMLLRTYHAEKAAQHD